MEFVRRLGIVAVLLGSSVALSGPPKATKQQISKLMSVKTWYGKVTVTVTHSGPVYDNPDMHKASGKMVSTLSRSFSLNGKLSVEDPGAPVLLWTTLASGNEISGSASVLEETLAFVPSVLSGKEEPRKTVRKGANPPSRNQDAPEFGSMQLEIDPEAGTYSLGAVVGVPVRGTDPSLITDDNPDGKFEEVDSVDGNARDVPLPASGLVLSDSRTFPLYPELVPEGQEKEAGLAHSRGVTAGDPNQVQKEAQKFLPKQVYGTIRWSFSPTPPSELAAEIIPSVRYNTWMPSARQDDEAGDSLQFEARLFHKDRPNEPVSAKATWKWELIDTSQEKGIALNFPRPGKGNTEFDLRFAEKVPELEIAAKRQVATSKEPANRSNATVYSYDFGGYARLRVTATVNGQPLVAELQGAPGKQEVSIPKDENHNKVADVFEGNDLSRGTLWDEDPPMQRRLGDGYTLYEEYRGFFVLMPNNDIRHTRLTPDRKDLFVLDADDYVLTEFGGDANPAGLKIHYVDRLLMRYVDRASQDPEHRWMNFNASPDTSYAKQYALHLVKEVGLGEDIVGAAICKDNFKDLANGDITRCVKQPLKSFFIVKVDPTMAVQKVAAITDPVERNRIAGIIIGVTVKHELGHALGAGHHQTMKYGSRSCVMRYEDEADHEYPPRIAYKNRFCTRGEKYSVVVKVDKTGAPIGPPGQQLPSDDCWGQLDVKSDP